MVTKVGYDVLDRLDNIEIRRYPTILLATVYGEDESEAFNILFRYISGSNESGESIEMTAPVVSSLGADSEARTNQRGDFFTFVMPGNYGAGNIPKPEDSRVKIHVQEEKKFAVLRFRGRATEGMVSRKQRELLKSMSRTNYGTRGSPFLMRYNSPFMPGFMRTNEIGIEILQPQSNGKLQEKNIGD
jgi:hypothetical protein